MKLSFILIIILSYSINLIAQEKSVGNQIGDIAIDIAYPSPDADTIRLSSLRGKMVLIDFWASWCGPCRRENPHVVAAYNKFKNENFKNGNGFVVYNVSLDHNAEKWKGAIVKDKLDWKYHVSDLRGWKSEPAKKYGVNSIPANFLIDGNGVIVARNLRGSKLETKLEELVKKNEFKEIEKQLLEIEKKLDELKDLDDYKNQSKSITKIKSKIEKSRLSISKLKEEVEQVQ